MFSDTNDTQALLVNADNLPLDQLGRIRFTTFKYANETKKEYKFLDVEFGDGFDIPLQQPVEVVSVRRPDKPQLFRFGSTQDGALNYKLKDINVSVIPLLANVMASLTGGVLLPHNIGDGTHKLPPPNGTMCSVTLDRRAQNYANNHMYMETTLQSTYAARAFFLFQYGVAKDVLNQNGSSDDPLALTTNAWYHHPKTSSNITLDLDGNVYKMGMRLSTPPFNAFVTFSGCGVLLVALIVGLVQLNLQKASGGDHLAITGPHTIARVMVDDETFPALLLKRDLEAKQIQGDADQFFIQELRVRPAETSTEDDISKQI